MLTTAFTIADRSAHVEAPIKSNVGTQGVQAQGHRESWEGETLNDRVPRKRTGVHTVRRIVDATAFDDGAVRTHQGRTDTEIGMAMIGIFLGL